MQLFMVFNKYFLIWNLSLCVFEVNIHNDIYTGKHFQNWTSEMKVAEGSVNGGSEFDDDGLPPIRSGVISLSGNSTQVSIYVHEAFSLDEISKP